MFFWFFRIRFLKISCLNCGQCGENQYRKKEHNQHGSVFKALRQLSYFVNVTDPLIIPMILIFLSCHEKAHDNKEFNHEYSKLHCESGIRRILKWYIFWGLSFFEILGGRRGYPLGGAVSPRGHLVRFGP